MITKEDIRGLLSDRALIISLITLVVLSIGVGIYSAFQISPSLIQIPVSYTAYSLVNVHTDRWYYLISFPMLALIIALLHSLIALKLHAKRRELAIGFVCISIVVVALFGFVSGAVFNLVSKSI